MPKEHQCATPMTDVNRSSGHISTVIRPVLCSGLHSS